MQIIKGRNINQIVYNSLKEITTNGYRTQSRNGDVLAIYDNELILENPKSRHLMLKGRTNNFFATLAECFWVMSGKDDIDYLSFFIPRAPLYSDDNKTWRAAYGERMYAYNQLQNIIDVFTEEGITSRRGVMSLLFPNRDTKESLKSKYNLTSTKDTPCNNWLNFFITPDKKLNLKVSQRSGDIIFGTGNINLPEFTLLQEWMLQQLKEIDKDLTLGYYHHSVTNLHLYDFNGKQGYDVLDKPQILTRDNYDNIEFPSGVNSTKEFFSEFVDFISNIINYFPETSNYNSQISLLNKIFDNHSVTRENNLLYSYAQVILAYTINKLIKIKNLNISTDVNSITVDISIFSEEYQQAVKFNKFLNFEVFDNSDNSDNFDNSDNSKTKK